MDARTLGNAVDMSSEVVNLPSPLPSWEQPAEMVDGFDQFLQMLPNLSAPAVSTEATVTELVKEDAHAHSTESASTSQRMTAAERRKDKNKHSQKRFRDRQRARAQELEQQFAATTAELQDLKSKQKTLEARNLLLEKLVQMSKQQQQQQIDVEPASVRDKFPDFKKLWGQDALPGPLSESVAQVPTLKLTVSKNREQVIPVREVGKLSLSDFAKIYTTYSHALGSCLMELQQDTNSPALKQLQTWVVEMESLFVCIVLSSPGRLKEINNSRMDEGVVCSADRPADFYSNLLKAVDFTDSQIQDLLYLRQLLYSKQGQLARERKALLNKMACNSVEYMGHVSDKLSELTQWSEDLRRNGAEEYRIDVEFCTAYYTGILTAKQFATATVYAYPFCHKHDAILEQLAADHGEPSVQTLLEDTSVDDIQHAANWQEVVNYLTTIKMEDLSQHTPLLTESKQ